MAFKPYHYIWLSQHPNRSEEWLRAMLKEGFDIHHLDGDHNNNDPKNVVLIEHSDHMMLHGGRMLGRLKRVTARKYKPRLTRKKVEKIFNEYRANRNRIAIEHVNFMGMLERAEIDE